MVVVQTVAGHIAFDRVVVAHRVVVVVHRVVAVHRVVVVHKVAVDDRMDYMGFHRTVVSADRTSLLRAAVDRQEEEFL